MSPIPMILTCPSCCERHIDAGEFATKPHHTHACQGCGMVWRPALLATVGVQFLPGFKDAPRCGVAFEQSGARCQLPFEHEGSHDDEARR